MTSEENRKAFEVKFWRGPRKTNSKYIETNLQYAWIGWKARDTLAQQENKTLRKLLQEAYDMISSVPRTHPTVTTWLVRAAEVLKEE